jgi:hypothetical protein
MTVYKFMKERGNEMKYKVGDTVRIRSKEWMDAQDKNHLGSIDNLKGSYIMNSSMQEYAGETTKIVVVHHVGYSLDIDNHFNIWQDWMFDPDYSDDGPLDAEYAVRAMLDGETLYDKEGNPRRFSDDEIESFMSLYRIPPKRKRLMNRWEALDWANSEASRGWVVLYVYDNGNRSKWVSPQFFEYDDDIDQYRRARLRPDLSGVDEDTIQGFEVEE